MSSTPVRPKPGYIPAVIPVAGANDEARYRPALELHGERVWTGPICRERDDAQSLALEEWRRRRDDP